MNKLPKGRVMFTSSYSANPIASVRPEKTEFYDIPLAVIPCATQREARDIVRLHAMTHEKRVTFLLNMLHCAVAAGEISGGNDLAYIAGFVPDWLLASTHLSKLARKSALNLNPRKP